MFQDTPTLCSTVVTKTVNEYLKELNLKIVDGDRGNNYPNGDEFLNSGYCLFLNAKNVTLNGFNFHEKSFITKHKDYI